MAARRGCRALDLICAYNALHFLSRRGLQWLVGALGRRRQPSLDGIEEYVEQGQVAQQLEAAGKRVTLQPMSH